MSAIKEHYHDEIEKGQREALEAGINEDLKQYLTNLLYSAFDKGANYIEPPQSEKEKFDKWVEEMIDGIDEYFKVNP